MFFPVTKTALPTADGPKICRRWSHFDVASHFPWTTSLVALAAFVVGAIPALGDLFVYDAVAIRAGELWRLITGHLVHAGGRHLFLDAAALFAAGSICEAWHRKSYPVFLAIMAVLTTGTLYFYMPELRFYCGLSALCTATFVWACGIVYKLGRRRKMPLISWTALISALGLIAKICYEALTGEALFVTHMTGGFAPLPFAHVFGALLGGAAYYITREEKPKKLKRRTVT